MRGALVLELLRQGVTTFALGDQGVLETSQLLGQVLGARVMLVGPRLGRSCRDLQTIEHALQLLGAGVSFERSLRVPLGLLELRLEHVGAQTRLGERGDVGSRGRAAAGRDGEALLRRQLDDRVRV